MYFTIDLEEWWAAESFKPFISPQDIESFDDRMLIGLDIFLDQLEKHNKKATFFVLGRVAKKHPHIIPMLVDKGHDIGTHGFHHELIYKQSPDEFKKDLVDSLEVISSQCNLRINMYRAPSYSITAKSLWALDILKKNGIDIDSSISPAPNKRFGIPGVPEVPYHIETPSGTILEVPPNVTKILGKSLPITSGIAFRMFPISYIEKKVEGLRKKQIKPMFIFHNWETDIKQPRLNVSAKANLIHYGGINGMEKKVDRILSKYLFGQLRGIQGNFDTYTIQSDQLERKF